MSKFKSIFLGTFVSANSLENFNIHHGFICVENGKITNIGSEEEYVKLESSGKSKDFEIIQLEKDEFIMPGLVDCHTHGPQFPNIGLGLDRPLLEWLDKYTFPLEKKYSDVEFAKKVYDKVVKRLIYNGTTTACYYGSIHLDGTMELVNAVVKHKQRALVGKVSMNVKNDAGYYNDTDTELQEVEKFVKDVQKLNNDLVEPVITPRFAVSCDEKLMSSLAAIAGKYGCRIQSHISENQKEVEHVLKEYPTCKSYSEVYDKSKILNKHCIMAHAVYLDSKEMKLLATKGVSVAHCPASNTRLRSGLCPVRELLDNQITVGLGTDVSGGDSSSVLDAIRRTLDVSTHLELTQGRGQALNWKEAFYLATMGGAKALSLDNKIGDFQVGKEFDALRIKMFSVDSQIDQYDYSVDSTDDEMTLSLIQRFIYLGDDRNITEVYVKGRRVK